MARPYPTAERLGELLSYDPLTGLFTWLVQRKGPGAAPGKVAGGQGKNGYTYIGIDGTRCLAHRLAFIAMLGAEPPTLVDHLNGNRMDNRWANLRAADSVVNAQNTRRPHVRNTSGFLGVSWSTRNITNPWLAQIKPPGSGTKNLGYYATPEEAHAAYLDAKRKLHAGNTL